MKKLLRGILDFRDNIRPGYREQFAKLALEQKPDALMIACSDSRVVPNLFASADPGDLFVVRNVGNLVPPAGVCGLSGEAAAIEFSLRSLPITDIILCGHSNCGAMQALLNGADCLHSTAVTNWLKFGERALTRFRNEKLPHPKLAPVDRFSQLNVLEQIESLKTYPVIRERLARKQLRLHAWWFDIAEARVDAFREETQEFQPIDESYAEQWLRGLSAPPNRIGPGLLARELSAAISGALHLCGQKEKNDYLSCDPETHYPVTGH